MSSELFIPLNPAVVWVTANSDGVIALNKGVGVLSHPNKSQDRSKSLLQADFDFDQECYHWKNEAGEEQKLWLVNRLDVPTSGLILLAKSLELKRALRACFEDHKVEKEYQAIVRGVPKSKRGVWSGKLVYKNRHKGSVSKSVLYAKTRFQLERSSNTVPKLSRLKLNPVTGRMHQLRIHCAENHVPIIGDQIYGDFKCNHSIKRSKKVDRLLLHCSSVKLTYTLNARPRSFEAKVELPDCFHSIIGS